MLLAGDLVGVAHVILRLVALRGAAQLAVVVVVAYSPGPALPSWAGTLEHSTPPPPKPLQKLGHVQVVKGVCDAASLGLSAKGVARQQRQSGCRLAAGGPAPITKKPLRFMPLVH